MSARPSIPAIQGSSTECDFHGPSVQDVMSVLGACRVAIEHVVIFFGIVKGWVCGARECGYDRGRLS